MIKTKKTLGTHAAEFLALHGGTSAAHVIPKTIQDYIDRLKGPLKRLYNAGKLFFYEEFGFVKMAIMEVIGKYYDKYSCCKRIVSFKKKEQEQFSIAKFTNRNGKEVFALVQVQTLRVHDRVKPDVRLLPRAGLYFV